MSSDKGIKVLRDDLVKRYVNIIFWLVLSVVVLLVLILMAGPKIFNDMTSPDHRFGDKPVPTAPDYNRRMHWAAWPDSTSPAERLPTGVTRVPVSQRKAAAFFLHPTTFFSKNHWVQPMDDQNTIRDTDFGTISTQASAFNGCCNVYAPRFRQSNTAGYQQGQDLPSIFNLAYQDIRAAFNYFLNEIGPDQPFILASHSQGTFHLIRLIMEEVDATPLSDRLIAAYAIGHSLPQALVDRGYLDIDICQSSLQTGCFISWDAHEADRQPSAWSEDEEKDLWNGESYSGFGLGQNICVNPINWRTDSSISKPKEHLGGLLETKGSARFEQSLGDLMVGTVSAFCQNSGHSNWLMINGDRSERLKPQGIWSLFSRNLHGYDYSLFWANIRQNAINRTNAYIDLQ